MYIDTYRYVCVDIERYIEICRDILIYVYVYMYIYIYIEQDEPNLALTCFSVYSRDPACSIGGVCW